ncbi:MAG TPA: NADH-quinone oxidoreductase subunit D [Candidatus Akkermansia intestinigallinarum]|uniref:NADH-quinone oxidoreductase subunit D n=1 Tax=Candidatus Akkermansia intestinigallinarum TaxID=2838431 RepID=A0A9D1VC13_9BACT|nr:NADH-quinone oxidoreductase subunit D [Candidatus Akkermansia intestinigallinarum]
MNTTKFVQVPDAAGAAMEYLKNDADDQGELMTLNMGPSHPATHGVLRLKLVIDGEVIVSCDPVVGYLHRGMEKMAENCHYNQYVAYTDRFDYLAPMSNNIAYACAVEKLLGWQLPERGQAIRVLCCELSRISSYFLGVGVYAMDAGAMTAFLYSYEEKERVHNLYELICGARFTSSYTRIGGMTRDLPAGIEKPILEFCDSAEKTVEELRKLLLHNKIFIDRLVGVGVITREMALQNAMTGPNLRSSGVARDLRKTNPYLGYENYDFDVPVAQEGDCYARFQLRLEEILQSVRIIRQVIAKMPKGPIWVQLDKGILPRKEDALQGIEELIRQFMVSTECVNAPAGQVYFAAENPKGELGFFLDSQGGGIANRLKMRSPSFGTLSILPELLPGHLVSDVGAILGSLDFVQGECDR